MKQLSVFSIGIIQTITLTFSAKFGTVVQVSLPPTPCQQCWNYFEIPSGRNHHCKYLKFQFIKRQRLHHTKTLYLGFGKSLGDGVIQESILNTPKALVGSTSLSPQEYPNSSARTSVRKEKNKVTLMALSWHMWDAHTCCFFTGAKRGAENHVKQSQTFGVRFHRSHSPVPYAELGCLLSAGRYQGDWASQAWSASCEGYIPQKVKAQIKPLCKMSTVPAEVLWNLSAVLAYVGHLEIKWNRNNCGQRKSPSCSQPCVTDPMIASPTWNTRFTHEKPHVWLFSWSNQL